MPDKDAKTKPTLTDADNGKTAPTSVRGSHPVALAVGSAVGRYVILERLGAGGAGVVYKAYNPDLDRRVAIKLVSRQSTRANERLAREAQALGKLTHPNVVSVHDVGTFGDDVFIAMSYIDGPTLREWLNTGRTRTEIFDLFMQAGRGLAAAHAAGVVHRDFKPENVMVGADGVVRVLDFGLARAADPADEAPGETEVGGGLGAALTRTGAVLGTPAYMAPEQFRAEPADERSDQFSFCVALYEALCATRPFRAETMSDLADIVSRGQLTEPADVRRLPSWLRRTLLRGLSLEPEERHASMDALLDLLARTRTRRRRRIALACAAVVAVAAVAAYGLWSGREPSTLCSGAADRLAGVWDDEAKPSLSAAIRAVNLPYAGEVERRVVRQLDRYAAQWVEARTEACEATHLHGDQSQQLLDLRMLCLDDRLVEMRALIRALSDSPSPSALDRAAGAAGLIGSVERCADTEALLAGAQTVPRPGDREEFEAVQAELARALVLYEMGQFQEGKPVSDRALARAEALGYEGLIADAAFYRGAHAMAMTRPAEATIDLHRAARLALQVGKLDRAAAAWDHLTWAYAMTYGGGPEAEIWSLYAEAIARGRPGKERRLATVLARRGIVYALGNKLDLALDYQRQALALRRKVFGEEHIDVAWSLQFLGRLYARRGEYDDAIAHLQQAIAMFKATASPGHPQVGAAINGLGAVYMSLGKWDEAEAAFREALALLERSLGPVHMEVAGACEDLGGAQLHRGDYDAALESFRRADAICVELAGEARSWRVRPLLGIGDVFRQRGDLDRAEETYRQAAAIADSAIDRTDLHRANAQQRLGMLALERGDHARALDHAESSLALREKELGPEHPSLAQTLVDLADLHRHAGRMDTVRQLVDRVLGLAKTHTVDPELIRRARAIAEAR